MFAKIPQRPMHVIRWILAIGWVGLTASLLFGDRTGIGLFTWAARKGTSVFWGTIVPTAILVLLVFGHEGWRRLCPLGFMSQIAQHLGIKAPKRVAEESWLGTYHLYVQFGLLFLGLVLRLVWFNGNPVALGILFIATIVAAVAVGWRYGGRSWCHYFCPMSPVQTVISGPRGIFASAAHTAPPLSLRQSKCRDWDRKQQKQVSACVTCKSPCVDIDAERTYWEELFKPGRQLVQYGYLGLVVGFFGYFFIYSGTWSYYYEGLFYSAAEAGNIWEPGMVLTAIPRIVAIPATLLVAATAVTLVCRQAERLYKGYLLRASQHRDLDPEFLSERARHQVFAIVTVLAYNLFFAFGWRTLIPMDSSLHHVFTLLMALLSAWWLYRNFDRESARYQREGEIVTLRRQLKKLPVDLSPYLNGRRLEDLDPDELYLLANTVPQVSQDIARELYKGLVEESLEKDRGDSQRTWAWLEGMQKPLGLSEREGTAVLTEIGRVNPELVRTAISQSQSDRTLLGYYRTGLTAVAESDPGFSSGTPAVPTQSAAGDRTVVGDALDGRTVVSPPTAEDLTGGRAGDPRDRTNVSRPEE